MHMRMWINSYKRNLEDGHMLHVYDFLVRVPLIVRWPRVLPAGAVHHRMVRQPDILPTVLDLLGIDPERIGDIDGRSFKPLIEGAAWQPPPAFLSVSGLPADLEIRGVRTEEYKYTYGPENPELPEELYDLRTDPGETQNLAATEPKRCAELRGLTDGLLPLDGREHVEMMTMTADEQQIIERRLQALGYIE
jgi:arylsulfatase A-like enzyme